MQTFDNAQDAKEFLVGRIVDQAERENAPLSEIERKMLYFSETYWTLPDIWDVNAAFEQDYDAGEYEQKIAKLVQDYRREAKARNPSELESWKQAVQVLRKEDHYLLVMIGIASGRILPIGGGSAQPNGMSFWKMVAITVVVSLIGCGLVAYFAQK